MYADGPLRQARRALSTGTHLHDSEPLRQRLFAEFGDVTFADLTVEFQCCAASIERAAEHWFTEGRVVDAVMASAAVPGLLPPAKVGDEHFLDGGIVNSIPVGPGGRRGRRPGVRAAGRPDRPPAERAPPAVGGGAGVVRDRAPAPLPPRDGRGPRRGRGPRAPGRRLVAGRQPAGLPRLRRRSSARSPRRTPPAAPTSRSTWSERPNDRGTVPADRAGPGRDRADHADVDVPAVLADRHRRRGVVRAGLAAPGPADLGDGAAPDPGEHHPGRAVRALDRERVRALHPAALVRAGALRHRAGLPRRVLPRGPPRAAGQGGDDRAVTGGVPGRAAAGVLPARRSGRLVPADVRADALVRPGAARRAQGHPRLGPGRRHRAAPAAEPVRPAQPGRRARTWSPRSPTWRATSTTTTRS